ncbi:four helix bundle protein [Lunatimonas salinarum]|uniref:four helix bundle protein n=1 Tax=Lunatimonas salinarum TaxID=1774590 RepID=UPI001ADFCD2D|nr:four helix bundle protein [Lunatimonas salinarum]
MHRHKDLEIWKRGIELAALIYRITDSFPEKERFGLSLQIRRSSVSVPSNIAEGSGRSSERWFLHFLNISYASLNELETQLIIANRVGYLSETEFEMLSSEVSQLQKMIFKLIQNKRREIG